MLVLAITVTVSIFSFRRSTAASNTSPFIFSSECVSFSYNFTCDTPHNQFTQFFIGFVFVHRMKRLLASMNDSSTHTHTHKLREEKRIGEEKNPSKPRRNLTIINQFSIFRLHLTLCACYQKHILNQYLVRRSLIDIHGRHLPFIRLSSMRKFCYAIFLIFCAVFFCCCSYTFFFRAVLFPPVETKI